MSLFDKVRLAISMIVTIAGLCFYATNEWHLSASAFAAVTVNLWLIMAKIA